MATLSELVDRIATVEGVDPATVGLVARYIREAGLIATGGRGSSAAAMGITDATNLLIGVNATTVAAEAASAVRTYRALEAHEFRFRGDPSPAMKYGTFGDAVAQLIDAAGGGELPERFLNREVSFELQEAFAQGAVHVQLRFRLSKTSAFLGIARNPMPDAISSADVEQYLTPKTGADLVFNFEPPTVQKRQGKRRTTGGDRVEEVTIGYATLSAVAQLLTSSLP